MENFIFCAVLLSSFLITLFVYNMANNRVFLNEERVIQKMNKMLSTIWYNLKNTHG